MQPRSEGSSVSTQMPPRGTSFTGNRGPNGAPVRTREAPGDGKAPAAPGAWERMGSSRSVKIQAAVPESCHHPGDVGRWAQGGQCGCGAAPCRPGPPCPAPHHIGAPARPLRAEVAVAAGTGAAGGALLFRAGGPGCEGSVGAPPHFWGPLAILEPAALQLCLSCALSPLRAFSRAPVKTPFPRRSPPLVRGQDFHMQYLHGDATPPSSLQLGSVPSGQKPASGTVNSGLLSQR